MTQGVDDRRTVGLILDQLHLYEWIYARKLLLTVERLPAHKLRYPIHGFSEAEALVDAYWHQVDVGAELLPPQSGHEVRVLMLLEGAVNR